MSDYENEEPLVLVSETDNYAVLLGEDADGEPVYNVDLGFLTLHLLKEEWQELLKLVNAVPVD
jgi:hypothetical protein